MTACSFENLVQYLDGRLDLDKKLELLEHIDACETCKDAIYHISRDRDAEFFVYRPYRIDKVMSNA